MGSAQYGRQTYQTQRSVNFKIVACLFSGRWERRPMPAPDIADVPSAAKR